MGRGQYGHAEVINRRARWGVLALIALVAGASFAVSRLGGEAEPPAPTVLALVASAPPQVETAAAAVAAPPPPASTTTLATLAGPPDPASPGRLTVQPEQKVVASTTSTTQPPAPPVTRPPASTTTTSTSPPPPTTSTLPPTTTTVPTTTTTTTTTLPPTTTTTTLPPTTTTTSTTLPPTTTTTLPPTTTTTTIPQVSDTMHIHALKGRQRGDDDSPTVRFQVRVRNQNNKNVRGAVVTARVSGMGDVTATTNNKGWARFDTGEIDRDTVTITVTGMTHSDYVYAPEENDAGPSLTLEIDD